MKSYNILSLGPARARRTPTEPRRSSSPFLFVSLLAPALAAVGCSGRVDTCAADGLNCPSPEGLGPGGAGPEQGNGGGATATGGTGGGAGGGTQGTGSPAGGGSSVGGSGSSSGGGGGSAGSGGKDGSAGGGTGSNGAAPLGAAQCELGVAPSSQLLHLSDLHYDFTLRDLLELTAVDAAQGGPPSALLATTGSRATGEGSYQEAAALIAAQVMAGPLRANFIACGPAASGCLETTIAEFGRRAFRRPLTGTESSAFLGLVQDPQGDPDGAAETLLAAFLVSPSFLQRAELGQELDSDGNFVLTSHEVASRLSYYLWGSMPDDALSAAADADELKSKEQIRTQAERMVRDPKARPGVAHLHQQYRGIGPVSHWANAAHDAAIFPDYTADVAAVVEEEVEAFFTDVVFSGGSFEDLFLSPVAYVNAATAPLYGLNPGDFGMALARVELAPDERPGFLTRVGFLSSYSSYDKSSPILRGSYVMREVLGIDVGAPPAFGILPHLAGEFSTNRALVEELTSPVPCALCHVRFLNPPGYSLENYDAVGTWQVEERTTGAPIDPVAKVYLGEDLVTVETPLALMQELAGSKYAQRHYADKLVSFAFGRLPNPQDACIAQDVAALMGQGHTPLLKILVEVTQADAFRLRAVP